MTEKIRAITGAQGELSHGELVGVDSVNRLRGQNTPCQVMHSANIVPLDKEWTARQMAAQPVEQISRARAMDGDGIYGVAELAKAFYVGCLFRPNEGRQGDAVAAFDQVAQDVPGFDFRTGVGGIGDDLGEKKDVQYRRLGTGD
jgi:hypothetical protein